MKQLIHLIFFLFFLQGSNALANKKKFDWTIKAASFNATNTITVLQKDLVAEESGQPNLNPKIQFETRSPASTAYSFAGGGFGLSYSQEGEFDEEQQLEQNLETKSSTFVAFYDFLKLSTEVFIMDQKGYVIANPQEIFSNWDQESMKPEYPEMRVKTQGLSIYYTFDDNDYSIAQMTSQTEKLTHGFGFSWLVGLQAKSTTIENIPTVNVTVDDIGEITIDDINIASWTPYLGAGWHFGAGNFYVSPALMLGAARVTNFSDSSDVAASDLASKLFFPFGYHGESFFMGVSTQFDHLPLGQELNEVKVDRLNAEVFIGAHF